MRYAVLLGISFIGHGEQGDMVYLAQRLSDNHPGRIVRILDTHTDEIVFTYRDGVAVHHG